ncbi:MAG: hypothetical protein IKE30_07465 [Clostridia bacterium]|nr:hypothetical protein [Clostridia bacterium]
MKPKIGRYVVTVIVILLAFARIWLQMYDMQVLNANAYVTNAESKTTKTITLTGKRGTIYDANLIPLAYDKLAYDVQFYRDPSKTSAEDRAAYTQVIWETIQLIEANGKSTIDGFWLEKGEDGKWHFNTGTENEAVAAKRISQWRGNFYLSEAYYPEQVLFDTLCENYSVPKGLSEEDKVKILTVWQQSRMYNYLSVPVTIAYNVGYETVAEIEARSNELKGISIQESTTRVYPKGPVAAHVVGYISKISGQDTLKSYLERGYPNDAQVGMTGIESSMEDQLSPNLAKRQGKRVVEINNRGKIIREIEYQAPVDGNDVVLTLDTQLQEVMENALEANIKAINAGQQQIMQTAEWRRLNREELIKYELQGKEVETAKTGAAVAMDPYSGRVYALASYPSYDLTMFEGGTVDLDMWRELQNDERNPMYNRAISARDTPGSIFKLCTALGSLSEGVLTLDERISDMSPFTKTGDTSHQPSCWIGRSNRGKHANQTIVEGLKNSCNYFFFECGFRLGSDKLTKWAALLGLTSRTGIELPSESTSFVGNQLMLYDSNRAIDDQYTSKPYYAAFVIKRKLREIGVDRGIAYDEDRLNRVAKEMLDLVNQEGTKEEWIPQIRQLLLEEMNIPARYISNHFLVNEFYSYIQDLRWTASETIQAAIGQSITEVTPIAVSRYVSTIANGGTVYDAQVIDKIISPTGEVVLQREPGVVNRLSGVSRYIAAIQEGMKEVTSVENDGTAAQQFAKAGDLHIAAKTGTAQRSDVDIENNSWLITYAPYEDPQIVVVVYIQNGYAGARSASTAIKTIRYFQEQRKKTEDASVPKPNAIAK